MFVKKVPLNSGYRDDLIDRKESGCLNDCQMTHFFATMIRESYDIRATNPEEWYDPNTKTGTLRNYLLDPGNHFTDRFYTKIYLYNNRKEIVPLLGYPSTSLCWHTMQPIMRK